MNRKLQLSLKIVLVILLFTNGLTSFSQSASEKSYRIFDEVLFYDGYNSLENLASEMVPLPEGVVRHSTSLYATKLFANSALQIEGDLQMAITIKAACDNYDRIGNVFLSFVPKGQASYSPDSVMRIEIGRFITPFMNKNKQPTEVPYLFDVSYLQYIFNNQHLRDTYDMWLELAVFGVPYAANTQVSGCSGRNDVFYGSVDFITKPNHISSEMNASAVLLPLFTYVTLNNYDAACTDEVGKTIRSITFDVPIELSDAQFVLITSNHGANNNGEEYNRRQHYIYYDGNEVLTYKPGRTSCEPFRQYNTQGNGIYGTSKRTDSQWQSFSNWCPGDVIDNRVIPLGKVAQGSHSFKIDVPTAVFSGGEGYFPLSLYLVGVTSGELNPTIDAGYLEIFPTITDGEVFIEANLPLKSVDVYTTIGKKVYSGRAASIDFSRFGSGLYIVHAITENGIERKAKILKQ